MAKFLTTSATSNQIEQIILTAKKRLYLLSPYFQLSNILFERIKDADRRGVIIKIIYGKNELSHEEQQKLLSLSNVSVHFSNNLHAKCYFNETNMIITSMNLYEFSEKNNREMGVLLNDKEDLKAFTEAYNEASSIIKNSALIDINSINKKSTAYCIRCATVIAFDKNKPLCINCYNTWSKFKNKFYPEKYCHHCGKEAKSSINNPICQTCTN